MKNETNILTYVECIFQLNIFTFRSQLKIEKKSAKMASYTDLFKDENEYENFFEIEMNDNITEKLPIELFQEIEVELLDSLVNTDSDETDGPINLIK